MKAIGSKSLTNILFFIINVVWWLEWISYIIITGVFIITSFTQKYIKLDFLISFVPVNFKSVRTLNNNVLDGSLKVMNGNFSFLIQNSFLNTLICLIGIVALFSVILLITYELKMIFSSFTKNDPFNEMNIKRMNLIGIILIGFSFIQLILNILMNQYLKSHFNWNDAVTLITLFNSNYLVAGVIVIIIAGIIKLGASIENENKLTI